MTLCILWSQEDEVLVFGVKERFTTGWMRIKRNISKTSKPEVAFAVLQEHSDSVLRYLSNPNKPVDIKGGPSGSQAATTKAE